MSIDDVNGMDEIAATIPDGYFERIRTHGDAVVIAKRVLSDDESPQMVDDLATAIERRAKCLKGKRS